jgi:serine/threonine-protein kinase
MSISVGSHLGSYEITALLGKGGMGEVYRARDAKLKRDVAIKILPDEFSRDPDRLGRFQREAEVLASLNHMNIAAIYDLQEMKGTRFLVLELVEGETLAEAIDRGPLPVAQALNIALQISSALEAAHEKGVVHRDLKPANVKLMGTGQVKVLDFGLAKTIEKNSSSMVLSNSPTMNVATNAGVILGTAAYMSPEQARGLDADHRSDVFSFGCVLYEMLTGRRAFQGETLSDVLASVLAREPDLRLIPSNLTPRIHNLLRRCLDKNPKRRWQAAGDMRLEIEALLADPTQIVVADAHATAADAPAKPLWKRAIPFVVTAILAGAVAAWSVFILKPSVPASGSAIVRVTIGLPGGEVVDVGSPELALSSDGSQIAYVGIRGSTSQLYLRAMDSLETNALAGTEDGVYPFFSPDGKWIGFFAQGKLKKISVSGGTPVTLCDAANGRGGTWGSDDSIYFAPVNNSGILKVSSGGGKPQEVTKIERSKGEVSHRWPQLLPGGKAILFTSWNGPGPDERNVHLQILATGERRVLVQGGEMGRYVKTGHLVYAQGGTLIAMAFDLAGLRVSSSAPLPLVERVGMDSEGSPYTFSDQGSLVYLTGSYRENRLVWVDRKGNVESVGAPPQTYSDPVISPAGKSIAVNFVKGTVRLWIYDLVRTTLTPLVAPGSSQAPVFTPDGKRVIYRGTRNGFRNLYWRSTDGTGEEERLTTSDNVQTPTSASPDGKWVAYTDISPTTATDIWVVSLDGEHKAQPFLRTPGNDANPAFSPDGHWLAYESDESGRSEVYVMPFPGPGRKTQISADSGALPLWSRNGKELFYVNRNKIMAVDILTQAEFTAGTPHLLFEGHFESSGTGRPPFDVTTDGRFLMMQSTATEQAANHINVVMNWTEELKQRVPVK